MAFYDPAMASLPRFFPKIESYADALRALRQRGLLVNGYLHTEQISVLAESDPIVDYLGWQHLESELLVYLAANLLVSESRGASWLKSLRDNDTTEVGKTALLQNAGNRHACWLIKDPVTSIRSSNHIARAPNFPNGTTVSIN